MAVTFTCSMVGVITKIVKNSAREVMTIFGGGAMPAGYGAAPGGN
jgi:hypothetical protein